MLRKRIEISRNILGGVFAFSVESFSYRKRAGGRGGLSGVYSHCLVLALVWRTLYTHI